MVSAVLDQLQVSDSAVSLFKNISLQHDFVAISLVNGFYIPFALSWICNVRTLSVYENVVLMATDEEAYNRLRQEPGVNVVLLKGPEVYKNRKLEYGTTDFVKLMTLRMQLKQWFLENGITVVVFDLDNVWFKNPFPMLRAPGLKKFDTVSAIIHGSTDRVAGNFVLLRAGKPTLKLMKRVLGKLKFHLAMAAKKNLTKLRTDSQNTLYTSINEMKKKGELSQFFLPWNLFADGRWYILEQARNGTRPFMINNNWAVGSEKKIARAKKHGHWFLNS